MNAETRANQAKKDLQAEMDQAKRDLAGTSHLTSQAVTGAIAATLQTVGAGLALNASQKGNKFGRENAALSRAACEQGAQIEIDSLTRERQRIEADKANAIMQAALAAAAEQNIGEDVQKLAPGEPTKLPPIPIAGAPLPSSAKKGNFALTPGNGGGGGGGAVGGGGGGGGGGQSPGWNFGGGGGDSGMGGGLPAQGQSTATAFEGSGGGGDFGGFGEEPLPEEALMGEEMGEGEFAQAPAVGDGGLNVLMSRARIIYAKNASTLIRSLSPQRSGPAPASASVPTSIKGQL
jgi:hypothetical protein